MNLEKTLEQFKLEKYQINNLIKFKELFFEYNKKVNLSSIRDSEEFDLKNIKDSLSIINFFDFENKNILDFGSGGGFPGILLAIIYPNSSFTLIDSNNKKTKWLEFVSAELNLNNVTVIHDRIENLNNLEEKFDYVTCRAVAKTYILVELCSKFIKINGNLIFYKGKNYLLEQPDNKKIKKELGIINYKNIEWMLNDEIKRYIVTFKKIGKTKQNYPRKNYLNNKYF